VAEVTTPGRIANLHAHGRNSDIQSDRESLFRGAECHDFNRNIRSDDNLHDGRKYSGSGISWNGLRIPRSRVRFSNAQGGRKPLGI
jgi:hypothetical protein